MNVPQEDSAVSPSGPGASPAVVDALRSVFDPCCRERGISIVDMGLVRSIEVEEGRTRVELLLTSGWCPFASRMLSEARQAVEAMPSSGDVVIEVVWDEPWTMDRLSDEARSKLRFLPDPVAVADRDRYLQQQMDRDRPPMEVTTDDR
jgi:metal-sulfur cluster biosynthetic enzyme